MRTSRSVQAVDLATSCLAIVENPQEIFAREAWIASVLVKVRTHCIHLPAALDDLRQIWLVAIWIVSRIKDDEFEAMVVEPGESNLEGFMQLGECRRGGDGERAPDGRFALRWDQFELEHVVVAWGAISFVCRPMLLLAVLGAIADRLAASARLETCGGDAAIAASGRHVASWSDGRVRWNLLQVL